MTFGIPASTFGHTASQNNTFLRQFEKGMDGLGFPYGSSLRMPKVVRRHEAMIDSSTHG